MPSFSTNVVDDEAGVDRRLRDFGFNRDQFIAIADVAKKWVDDASPLMPLNAPGLLAYIHGVAELRQQLLDDEWIVDRAFGIEGVVNERLGMRIAFQNVDRACDPIWKPRPRTAKGNGAESISGPTLFEHFGIEPGPVGFVKADGLATYYVMVGEDGGVELSCPVVENGLFTNFAERVFIRGAGSDWDESIDVQVSTEDFDVPVSFKNNV